MWLTIELGADSAKLSQANMQTMKYVLRAMPICILPFTINFPGVSVAVPLNDINSYTVAGIRLFLSVCCSER
jgi:membrane protein insertase Oxa1/YidC/SpoIIIJ